jgi:hypothetical protein
MGARLYISNLGRFTQVDPIEGGVDNDYVWPTDPIGKNDLSGELSADSAEQWIKRGYVFTSLTAPARRSSYVGTLGSKKVTVSVRYDSNTKGLRLSFRSLLPQKVKSAGAGRLHVTYRSLPPFKDLVNIVGSWANTASVEQQWDCHALGARLINNGPNNPTWDLEAGRPSNPDWGVPWVAINSIREDGGGAGGLCNWK